MDYVRLGSTGLKVSRLCLGTMTYGTPAWRPWVLDEAASRPFIKRALEHGINFFDTADMYSLGVSEEVVGRALKDFRQARRGRDRDQGVLSGRRAIRTAAACRASTSCRRSTPRCAGSAWTTSTSIRSIASITTRRSKRRSRRCTTSCKAGKARYIGASSMYAWQFAKMLYTQRAHGWTRFVSMQNHYNLVYREEEREMIPLCLEEGIGVIPWSPLARGFLAGNRKRGEKSASLREQHDAYGHSLYYADADYDVADRVVEVAKQKGVLPIQVALAWILGKPGVAAPIVSATKLEQLDQLVDGHVGDADAGRNRALEEPYVPHKVIGIV